jgi:hypothetical protein
LSHAAAPPPLGDVVVGAGATVVGAGAAVVGAGAAVVGAGAAVVTTGASVLGTGAAVVAGDSVVLGSTDDPSSPESPHAISDMATTVTAARRRMTRMFTGSNLLLIERSATYQSPVALPRCSAVQAKW